MEIIKNFINFVKIVVTTLICHFYPKKIEKAG
jgi:hypothetical protein